MKLKTSKGHEYEVLSADGPTFTSGAVMIRLQDQRRLPEIAAEFDGLESFERTCEIQGNKAWEGYSVLNMITRLDDGSVRMALKK